MDLTQGGKSHYRKTRHCKVTLIDRGARRRARGDQYVEARTGCVGKEVYGVLIMAASPTERTTSKHVVSWKAGRSRGKPEGYVHRTSTLQEHSTDRPNG